MGASWVFEGYEWKCDAPIDDVIHYESPSFLRWLSFALNYVCHLEMGDSYKVFIQALEEFSTSHGGAITSTSYLLFNVRHLWDALGIPSAWIQGLVSYSLPRRKRSWPGKELTLKTLDDLYALHFLWVSAIYMFRVSVESYGGDYMKMNKYKSKERPFLLMIISLNAVRILTDSGLIISNGALVISSFSLLKRWEQDMNLYIRPMLPLYLLFVGADVRFIVCSHSSWVRKKIPS